MMIYKSPFNYTGSKQNTIEFLREQFPKDCLEMVDMFCGGGSVSINCGDMFEIIYMNDVIKPLIYFYNEIWNQSFDTILEKLEKVKISKESQNDYNNIRKKFNDCGAIDPYLFFALCSSCTNNMMRFNKSFKFNQTFGKRTINDSTIEKLKGYYEILHNNTKYCLWNQSFDKLFEFIKEQHCEKSVFFYLDPPYIQTEAGYNCYWSKELEEKLYDMIDEIDSLGYKFAMSNTSIHKGIPNPNMKRLEKYNIVEVPTFYNKAKKDKSGKESIEILVKNY